MALLRLYLHVIFEYLPVVIWVKLISNCCNCSYYLCSILFFFCRCLKEIWCFINFFSHSFNNIVSILFIKKKNSVHFIAQNIWLWNSKLQVLLCFDEPAVCSMAKSSSFLLVKNSLFACFHLGCHSELMLPLYPHSALLSSHETHGH